MHRRIKKLKIILPIMGVTIPSLAWAEWTPLISATMFDGIKADMITMVGGIVTLFFIVFGLVMLMRAGGR